MQRLVARDLGSERVAVVQERLERRRARSREGERRPGPRLERDAELGTRGEREVAGERGERLGGERAQERAERRLRVESGVLGERVERHRAVELEEEPLRGGVEHLEVRDERHLLLRGDARRPSVAVERLALRRRHLPLHPGAEHHQLEGPDPERQRLPGEVARLERPVAARVVEAKAPRPERREPPVLDERRDHVLRSRVGEERRRLAPAQLDRVDRREPHGQRRGRRGREAQVSLRWGARAEQREARAQKPGDARAAHCAAVSMICSDSWHMKRTAAAAVAGASQAPR